MKILIIAYYFPPRNTIASHRPYSWAYYWTQQGHTVDVLVPAEVVGDASLQRPNNGFRIIPVKRSCIHRFVLKRSVRAGSAVSGKFSAKPSGIRRLLARINRLSLRYGILRELRMPSFADAWIRPALRSAQRAAKAEKQPGSEPAVWDLCISTSNPYAVHLIAQKLRMRGLVKKWAADFRDPWTRNSLYPGFYGFRAFERLLERRVCNQADTLVTVGNVLANEFRQQFHGTGRPALVSYNGYEQIDEKSTKPVADLHLPAGKKLIVYTGSLYRSQRSPEPLFEALAQAKKAGHVELNLHVAFAGGNVDNLLQLIEQYGVNDLVNWYGPISYQQALSLQQMADVLLFIESGLPEHRGNVTGKLFEYIRTGKPVWALGITEQTESWQILEKTGKACLLNSSEKIRKACINLEAHPGKGGTKTQAVEKQQGILQFSRKNLAQDLLEKLQLVIEE